MASPRAESEVCAPLKAAQPLVLWGGGSLSSQMKGEGGGRGRAVPDRGRGPVRAGDSTIPSSWATVKESCFPVGADQTVRGQGVRGVRVPRKRAHDFSLKMGDDQEKNRNRAIS